MDVLLDLDGTLTDPAEGITRCIRHALTEHGHGAPAAGELTRFIGPPLLDSFAELVPEADLAHRRALLETYRERFREVGMFENRPYDGVAEALEALRAQGARLHLATSKPHLFARPILEHFDLAGHFTSIHGAELDGTRSDKADLLRHVLKVEGIDATSAIMVGDRRHDVAGARANRVRATGVLWGYGTREELVSAGADRLLETVPELAGLIGTTGVGRA